jgi:hypothetical protein
MELFLRKRYARTHVCLALLLLAWVSVPANVVPIRPAAAGEPTAGGRLDALLSAGEFGPARQLALQTAVPAERDQLLSRVAERQAVVGARRASLATAGQISDDRVLSRTLDQIGSRPVVAWDGARGGGTQADFDSLIELITSTIAPQSWDDVGGPGAIDGFEGGVYVDSAGLMKRIQRVTDSSDLVALRSEARLDTGNRQVSRTSALRKVSLNRLERQLQLRAALRQGPDESMRALAGITRVKYVLVYPETGDIVLSGPAGAWREDGEGRRVNAQSGQPVLHLDDLVVLLRNAWHEDGRFGCSITPTQPGLAATKAFLAESSTRALQPSERDGWLEKLRGSLGKQDIDVYGVDRRTRVARVLVEADYRMKLVGMGLEPGALGVVSYLDAIPVGSPPESMDVLRWWFTLNYGAVHATPSRNAFEIRGPGVKVLSENELITEQGKRQHTGKSDALNQQFAQSFTRHFDRLAETYPIYAELRNVFDLALVAALLRAEDLPAKANWHLTHFDDPRGYQVALGEAPRQVESVINHRVIDRKHIVAGVSGGVAVDTRPLVSSTAIKTDDYGALQAEHGGATPRLLPADAWWWD